jgi:intracellular sulfur oxidation DsrE/DsrF family protein
MAVDGMTSSATPVEELSKNKNVSFKVCGLTLERYNVERSQLITGVEVVPDAIIEIVNRQNEGWGYIKESHN